MNQFKRKNFVSNQRITILNQKTKGTINETSWYRWAEHIQQRKIKEFVYKLKEQFGEKVEIVSGGQPKG